jgi:hypothetical protein
MEKMTVGQEYESLMEVFRLYVIEVVSSNHIFLNCFSKNSLLAKIVEKIEKEEDLTEFFPSFDSLNNPKLRNIFRIALEKHIFDNGNVLQNEEIIDELSIDIEAINVKRSKKELEDYLKENLNSKNREDVENFVKRKWPFLSEEETYPYLVQYLKYSEDELTEIIERLGKSVNLDTLFINNECSESFILKNAKTRVAWCYVYSHQKLSENFIFNNIEIIDVDALKYNKYLSNETIEKAKFMKELM